MARLILAAALLGGAGLGAAGAAFMLEYSRRGGVPVDLPDARRLHTTPTPRGGGIGIPVAGVLAAGVAMAAASGTRLVAACMLVWALPNGLLGFIDDYRPLRSRIKFAVQLASASAAVALGLRLDQVGGVALGVGAWPISVLWLVWNANVFNFMDGMDGLAAGSGLCFFCGFGWWAASAEQSGLAVVAFALAGALLGFLRYNRPPARIFMGDAGSLFVGAALGALALAMARPDSGGISIVASTLLMGSFVWDATYTITRRALRGDPMLPHRTHLYQRLATAGWSHDRVRALYLGLALLGAAAAALYPMAPSAVIAIAAATAVGLVWITARAEQG